DPHEFYILASRESVRIPPDFVSRRGGRAPGLGGEEWISKGAVGESGYGNHFPSSPLIRSTTTSSSRVHSNCWHVIGPAKAFNTLIEWFHAAIRRVHRLDRTCAERFKPNRLSGPCRSRRHDPPSARP